MAKKIRSNARPIQPELVASNDAAGAVGNGAQTGKGSVEMTSQPIAQRRRDPEAIKKAFETGAYPYKTKMRRSAYDKHKAELQVELLKVQTWVQETGERIVILFEGRDAAGKGGTIKRFMEHLNPRGARVVALPKPGERARTQ